MRKRDGNMTIEKFNEIQGIVEEIKMLEEFIPVFRDSNGSSIRTIKKRYDSLGIDREYNIPLKLNGDMNIKVCKMLEERLEHLRGLFDKA